MGVMVASAMPPEVPLLKTKLHRPAPASDAVGRPRLLEGLASIDGFSLTLISAPAGYGKSTLASQWVEAVECPAGWVSLGERDNEPASFVRYFVEAVRTVKPEACPASLAAIDDTDAVDPRELAEQLSNELLELDERIFVVLDDFHHIHTPEVPQLLAHLLERPLATLHLVIISRRDPQIPLASLRAAGRLQELRMGALRFTPDESLSFVGQAFPAEVPGGLPALIEKTDGWPVALRLLVLRLGRVPDPATVMEGLPSIANDVREFLVAEVLDRLPPGRLSSLLSFAILDRFCAPLCEALSDEEQFDGRGFTRWLTESGLFVVPLDQEGHWFRFHHYFQEVLVGRLERELDEAALGDLHARASHWFEGEGLLDEAFEHGLKTPDCIRAADLIALPENPRPLHDYRLISGWLRRLPRQIAEGRPGTLAELAWQAVRDGRITDMEALFADLERLLEEQVWDPRETADARANIHNLRIQIHFYYDRLKDIVSCSEEALAELGPDQQVARQSVFMGYAIALTRLGESARGRQALEDAIDELADPGEAALVYSTECQVEALSLNVPGLKRAADRYVAFQEQEKNESHEPWTRYLAALARYQADELQEAKEILSVVNAEPGTGYDAAYFRQASLAASTLFAQGDHQAAIDAVEALRFEVLQRSNSRDAAVAEALRMQFAIRGGDYSQCAAWFESFDTNHVGLPFLYPARTLTYLQAALAFNTPEARAKAGEILAVLFAKIGDSACAADEVEIRVLRALLHEAEGRTPEADEDLGRAVALAAPGGALRVVADYGPGLAPILRRLQLDEAGLDYVGRVLAILGLEDQRGEGAQPLVEALSKREREILDLLAQRHSNKEIAERLFISVATVKRHVANILGKLGVHRRADAVAKAAGLGLLK